MRSRLEILNDLAKSEEALRPYHGKSLSECVVVVVPKSKLSGLPKVSFSIYHDKDGKWSDEMEGFFHSWGYNLHEERDGSFQYSVGIVEAQDGKVHLVNPEKITFIQ